MRNQEFLDLLKKVTNKPIRRQKHQRLDTPCWLYGDDSSHYNTIKYEGKRIALHRLSFELFYKRKLYNLLACHKCDIKNCINPEHVFAGTTSDNMKDALSKGRVKGIRIVKKLKRLTFVGDFNHGTR